MLDKNPDQAARKQVTVLFCDIADYTFRSASMDPEDLADEIRVFQSICTKVIDKYSGTISNFLGDGILAKFGHPYANEFDAEHAVRTGLEIIDEIEQNNETYEWRNKQPISIRIGIATGLVVVGEKAGKKRDQDEQIIGEAPNLAARLQAIADPNTVVTSLRTRRLVGGAFKFKDLGEQRIKGFSQPVPAWQLLYESTFQNRNYTSLKRVTTRFVSRHQELSFLADCYEKAINRDRKIVHLIGEAGIGKSRLLRVFEKTLKTQKIHRIRVSCSPYYDSTPLKSVVDEIYRWLQVSPEDDKPTIQFKIHWALSVLGIEGREYFALFCDLLSVGLPENIKPLEISAEEKHHRTIRFLARTVLALCKSQPVLLIVEDLHWSDPTTLELLRYITQNTGKQRLFAIFTSRPCFIADWLHANTLNLKLYGLDYDESKLLIRSVFKDVGLADKVKERLIQKSDGVPLYLEECSWNILNQFRQDDSVELRNQEFEVPDTLQDSLNARLDSLGKAKDFAQLAAAFGTFFTYSKIKKIATLNGIDADTGMDILILAGLLQTRPGKDEDRYVFTHVMFQDAAYQSLLKKYRHKYHLQIAQLFIIENPETIASQPELLAYHYSRTEQHDVAIDLWIKAGERAITKSAINEAKDHLYRGLRLVNQLPVGNTKKERELKLRSNLAVCQTVQSGYYGEKAKKTYERCIDLADDVGNAEQQWSALYGLWRCLICQAEPGKALSVSVKLQRLSSLLDDRMLSMTSIGIQAMTRKFAGKFVSAEKFFDKSVSFYRQRDDLNIGIRFGQDPYVTIQSLSAVNGLIRNKSKQSERDILRSIGVARNVGHPYTIAETLRLAAMYYQVARDMVKLKEYAAETIDISEKFGFEGPLAASNIFMAFSEVVSERDNAGIEIISQNLTTYKDTYGLLFYPYFQGLLAEAYLYLNQFQAAFTEANRVLMLIETHGELWLKVPMLNIRAESAARGQLASQMETSQWYDDSEALARNQAADLFLQRIQLSRAEFEYNYSESHPTNSTFEPNRSPRREPFGRENERISSVSQYII